EIEPEISGVLITLCDQPRISAKMLNQFSDRYTENNAAVVAAAYNGVAGVPALFSKQLFGELTALDGDKGARSLIRNRPDLSLIDLPEAEFDIDTPDDVKSLDS
ncbi:MAG: NTP transferase domain-containing protein, partial [Acidobacteriota bacterium]